MMDERGASPEFQMDRAEAAQQPRLYRVLFVWRNYARWELLVRAYDTDAATVTAEAILRHRLGAEPDTVADWCHAATEEIA